MILAEKNPLIMNFVEEHSLHLSVNEEKAINERLFIALKE